MFTPDEIDANREAAIHAYQQNTNDNQSKFKLLGFLAALTGDDRSAIDNWLISEVIETGREGANRIEEQHLAEVIRDDSEYLADHLLDVNGVPREDAYDILNQLIVDDRIPTSVRMNYVFTVNSVVQQVAVQLSDVMSTVSEQSAGFSHLQEQLSHLSAYTGRLEAGVLHNSDGISNVQNNVNRLYNGVRECANELRGLREESVDWNQTVEQMSGELSLVQRMINDSLDRYESSIDTARYDLLDSKGAVRIRQLDVELKALAERQRIAPPETVNAVYEQRKEKRKELIDAIKNQEADMRQFTDCIHSGKRFAKNSAAVLNFFGKKQLAQQVAVIGEATFAAAEAIGGLLGYGVAAPMMLSNPVTAVVGIASAIGGVVQLFRRRSGQDPHQAILKAIRGLSLQIKALQERMEELFEEVFEGLNTIEREMLFQFSRVLDGQASMLNELHKIHMSILSGFRVQEERTSFLVDGVNDIRASLESIEDHRDYESLWGVVNSVVHGHYPTEQFSADLNTLETLCTITGVNNQVDDVNRLVSAVSQADFSRATNYFVQCVASACSEETLLGQRLPNLSLYTLAVLLASAITYYRYPEPDFDDPMPQTVMDTLVRLSHQGESFERFILLSREDRYLEPLIAEYADRAYALEQAIIGRMDNKESELSLEHHMFGQADFQRRHQALCARFDRDIAVQIPEHWYVQNTQNIHKRKGYQGTDTNSNVQARKNKRNEYQAKIRQEKELILAGLSDYFDLRKQQVVRSFSDESYDLDPTFMNYHGCAFIEPEDARLPVLPMVDPITSMIPDSVLRAQALGLGMVRFTYTVDEAQSTFTIQAFLDQANLSTLIASTTLQYTSLFYGLQANVWWFWMGAELILRSEIDEPLVQPWDGGPHWHYITTTNNPNEPQQLLGLRDQIQKGTIEFDIVSNPEFCEEGLQAAIDEKLAVICRKVNMALYHEIHASGTHSVLSAAAAQFETAYRNLYGALFFAFHDTLKDPESDLSSWFELHISRVELLERFFLVDRSDSAHLSLRCLQADLSVLPDLVATLSDSLRLGLNNLQLEIALAVLDQIQIDYADSVLDEREYSELARNVYLEAAVGVIADMVNDPDVPRSSVERIANNRLAALANQIESRDAVIAHTIVREVTGQVDSRFRIAAARGPEGRLVFRLGARPVDDPGEGTSDGASVVDAGMFSRTDNVRAAMVDARIGDLREVSDHEWRRAHDEERELLVDQRTELLERIGPQTP